MLIHLQHSDTVKEHANSSYPYVRHCRLKKAPNRGYLESDLSDSDLYKDFRSKVEIH